MYCSKWTLGNKNANIYNYERERENERELERKRGKECVHIKFISDLRNLIRKTKTLNRLKGIIHVTIRVLRFSIHNSRVTVLLHRKIIILHSRCILLCASLAVIAKTSSYTRFIIYNGIQNKYLCTHESIRFTAAEYGFIIFKTPLQRTCYYYY